MHFTLHSELWAYSSFEHPPRRRCPERGGGGVECTGTEGCDQRHSVALLVVTETLSQWNADNGKRQKGSCDGA